MANSVFNRAPQKKLNVKLGKGIGQKAYDNTVHRRDSFDIASGLMGTDEDEVRPDPDAERKKAIKKAYGKIAKKAKTGKAKAEKALGKKIPDSVFKR